MNNEQVEKLHDAGFPFKENPYGEAIFGKGGGNGAASWLLLNPPTLSELIEACPKRVESDDDYINWFFLQYADVDCKTWVTGYRNSDGVEVMADGPTPEEAVANLYLALNRK